MKIAIVTGASSGIGRSAANLLADRGIGVILTYNSNPAGAEEAAAGINENGGSAVAMQLDTGRSETFDSFAELVAAEIEARWQRTSFDYLVNNAGFGGMSMYKDTTEELYDRFHNVLLKGPYFLTQRLLPMLADNGAIVNTVSTTGFPDGIESGYSAYGTMKAGLAQLTRYQAKELSPRGIRVNSVSPGPTRTGMSSDAFDQYPEIVEPLVERTALGRIGESDDIGKVISTLLSDECAWITGESIKVSGGYDL